MRSKQMNSQGACLLVVKGETGVMRRKCEVGIEAVKQERGSRQTIEMQLYIVVTTDEATTSRQIYNIFHLF